MTEEEALEALTRTTAEILDGVASYDAALARLNAKGIGEAVGDGAVRQLSQSAFALVKKQDRPRWEPAMGLYSLLYYCLETRDEPPSPPVAAELAWSFTSAASRALWFVPDPQLYQQATKRCAAAVPMEQERGNTRGAGDLLHALGTLNLDPYAANRSPDRYEAEMQEWRARAANGETWNHVPYFDLEADGLPSAEEALVKAADCYRQAAELREGRDRTLSLKALAQTLYQSAVRDLPCDRRELEEVARAALSGLSEVGDPAVYAEVVGYLRFAAKEEKVEEAFPMSWLSGSIDRSVDSLGTDKTAQLVRQAYVEIDDYDRLLSLLLDAAELFTGHQQECWYHLAVIRTFVRSAGLATYDLASPPESSVESLFSAAAERAREEDWDPARFAAQLLAIADVSVALDEEAEALPLLDAARQAAPRTLEKLTQSITFLLAQLLLNDGVNGVKRGDWTRAARRYAQALGASLDSGSVIRVGEVLARLTDVIQRGDAKGVAALCLTLEQRIDSIEVVSTDRVTPQLQAALQAAMRKLLEDGRHTGLLWRLIQLSSARRYAAMLAAGSAFKVDPVQVAPLALERITETTAEVLAEGYTPTAGDRLADASLLSPHKVGAVRLAGGTSSSRLANLEHGFDAHLYEALTASAEGSAGLLLTQEQIEGSLAESDVVIQYHFIEASRGGQAPGMLVSAISTREGTRWRALGFAPAPPLGEMVIDGVPVVVTELSARVQSLREHIVEDPESGDASQAAKNAIESLGELLIAPVAEDLEALQAAGKNHLCIVAPGPLSYAPFDVLAYGDGRLSDHWCITFLPTLQLLVRNYGGPALLRRRDSGVVAYGLSFENGERGYEPLPEAKREAGSVAATFGSEPVVEAEATERHVLSALQRSEYVHVATHGDQNPIAPAFHKLILTPDEENDDDGELNAYEVLGRDLRGLRLVTLSACETALGRFDRGLNPHGLPAMLLLAGAETVIGTLWEIETTCSERFFTSLYSLLKGGAGKLDAFGGARQATREHHPELRDWGAFYFLGGWE